MAKGQACIDIKGLAEYVKQKLDPSPSNCEEPCIYRVPKSLRSYHQTDYNPQIVSVGPLHYYKAELQAMQDYKIGNLQSFLRRTDVTFEAFLEIIKKKDAQLRKCYEETIQLENDDNFATMILVDAAFLIELFLREYDGKTTYIDYQILRSGDLWLIENQLPLFILKVLFAAAELGEGLSLIKISRKFRQNVLRIEEDIFEKHFSDAKHFLDWMRICFQPSVIPPYQTVLDDLHIPGAKELHRAGVKFELAKNVSPLDIKFGGRILKIPFLKLHAETERFYKNLLYFERRIIDLGRHGKTRYFNDYVIFISYLLNTRKAAELLVEKRIIGLGNSERSSTVFQRLVKHCDHADNFHYAYLVKQLQDHCNLFWPKLMVTSKQKYFNNPWACVSVIAAVVLFVLTIVQTVCSILAL